MTEIKKPRTWSWLLLFTTSATLLCCALPIALVALGMGAAIATVAASAPWIITLSAHKAWVFAISGLLILGAAWTVLRTARVCPSDPALAAECDRAYRWNRRFVLISGVMWCIGFVAAYVLPRVWY